MNRYKLTTQLKPDILNILNEQIGREREAATNYIAMAIWAEAKNYKGVSKFLYNHAKEEDEHMRKVVQYILDCGQQPTIPAIPKPIQTFTSLRKLFEEALQLEKNVSLAIHEMVRQTEKEGDITTHQFLQWFVDEQQEEENQILEALEILDMTGEEKPGLFLADQAIGKL